MQQAGQSQQKTVKIVVGEKEFSINSREFALLASSLEASAGLELETPIELDEGDLDSEGGGAS